MNLLYKLSLVIKNRKNFLEPRLKIYLVPALVLICVLLLRCIDPFDLSQRGLALADNGRADHVSANIVVLDIDRSSQKKYGRWPYDRKDLATIISRIRAEGAGAIIIDLPLQDPDRARGDDEFAKAIAGKAVILVQSVSQDSTFVSPTPKAFKGLQHDFVERLEQHWGLDSPLSKFLNNAAGVGVIDFQQRPKNYDKYPLILNINGVAYPSPVLEAIRYTMHEPYYDVRSTSHGIKVNIGQFLYIPADTSARFYINYENKFDILKLSEIKYRSVKDKIVIIGSSIANVNSVLATPNGAIPSHLVHAHALQTVLDGPPAMRSLFVVFLELTIGAVAGLIVWMFWQRPDHFTNSIKLVLILGITAGLPFVVLVNLNILMDPLWPSLLAVAPLLAGLLIKYQNTGRCYLCQWICKGKV